jgi:hypothetical protein
MGALVFPYWPGKTDEQCDLQPGFWNDCKSWGNWMAERERHGDVLKALRILRVDAVRTCKTTGMDDSQVMWVAPYALAADALWLRHLVMNNALGTRRIIETYAMHAHSELPGTELAQDLLDVASVARYAAQLRVPLMTLYVEW